jgi:hypothetical protein
MATELKLRGIENNERQTYKKKLHMKITVGIKKNNFVIFFKLKAIGLKMQNPSFVSLMANVIMNSNKLKSLLIINLTLGCTLAFGSLKSQDNTERIKEYLRSEYGENSEFPRRFIYNMVDLNDDGREEYLIGLMGPDFCGTGGCTMLILNQELKLISKITLVKYPIYLETDETGKNTNKFKNIFLRTGQVGYVKLVWNGKKYPGNPSTQPTVPESLLSGKTAYLKAEDDPAYEF